MKRLMWKSSAIALAIMTPAVAGAQVEERVLEEFRPAVSRTLVDRLLKREPQSVNPLDGSERADPSRVVYTVEIVEGKPANFSLAKEPDGARKSDVVIKKKISRADRLKPKPQDPLLKINPLVRKMIDSVDSAKRIEVLVVFTDPVGIPRFPEPATGERGANGADRKYSDRREEIIKSLEARRAADDQPAALLREFNAEIVERFWLINAYKVQIPAGAIEKLVTNERVLAVDPTATDIPPPQDADATNDVDDGRAIIRSDPYFGLGLNGGFIGLLDTGVRDTHVVFGSPDNLDFLRDCVGGGANCNTGAITTTDPWPHGTSSAAIISAGTGGARRSAASPTSRSTASGFTARRTERAAASMSTRPCAASSARWLSATASLSVKSSCPARMRLTRSPSRRTQLSIPAPSSFLRTAIILPGEPASRRRRSRINRSASGGLTSARRGRMQVP